MLTEGVLITEKHTKHILNVIDTVIMRTMGVWIYIETTDLTIETTWELLYIICVYHSTMYELKLRHKILGSHDNAGAFSTHGMAFVKSFIPDHKKCKHTKFEWKCHTYR